MRVNFALLSLTLVMSASSAYAQRPAMDDEKIPQSQMDEHEDFKNQRSEFPARPRNMWEVGISAGIVQVSGDVKSNWSGRGKDHLPALGYGVHVRKALGYVMSLRMEYFRGTAYGQNWQPSSGINNNPSLNGRGDNSVNYTDTVGLVFHNYRNKINDLSLEAIFTLNNIRYHKDHNKLGLNAIVGIGIGTYNVTMDHLDANGELYDYQSIFDLGPGDFANRSEILDALSEIYDSEYETAAEGHTDDPKLFEANYKPTLTGGFGISYLISPRISIALEHKVKVTNDDLLDGQRWEETNTLSRDFDTYHYSSLHLNFNLGKNDRNELPSWWVNPMTFTYQELAANTQPDMSDDDGDGVLNILDQEPDTRPDCPVDTRGVTLDSDKDGCPDCDDPEPFSSPERPIQNCVNIGGFGVTEQDVRRIVQEMLDDPSVSAGGADWYLPMIHFDVNSDVIRSEFFPELKHVAEVMKRFPTVKMEVVGHTDARNTPEYNMELSRRRAQNAINHISERYGIDAGRFILRFEGEDTQLVPSAQREGDHYMNRRVEFRPVLEE